MQGLWVLLNVSRNHTQAESRRLLPCGWFRCRWRPAHRSQDGIRETSEKTSQCSREKWGKPVWAMPFSGSFFTKWTFSLCLKCTQPFPTQDFALAVHHEIYSSLSNGGLSPILQISAHLALPYKSLPWLFCLKSATSGSFHPTHQRVSFAALNTICITLVYWFVDLSIVFLFPLNEGAWRQGPCPFCSLVYPTT